MSRQTTGSSSVVSGDRPPLDQRRELLPRFWSRREDRFHLEVEGDLGILVLHLRDAGLVGADPLCQLRLRESALLPKRTNDLAESHFRLDERLFGRGEVQKLADASELPTSTLELLSLFLVHDLSTFLKSASRRRHCANT